MFIYECTTIDDLITLYKQNKQQFKTAFQAKHYNKNKEKLIELLGYDTIIKHNKQFSKIFYDYLFPHEKEKLCRYCNKHTRLFKSFDEGYKIYCSKECSINDPHRMRGVRTEDCHKKRKATMATLMSNDEWRQSYTTKISIKSKYYNNLPELKLRKSESLKQKIASGEFTPCVTNSWTHWSFEVNNKKFRSSFEGLFYYYMTKAKKSIEYETLRIPYYFDHKHRVYIVDFVDHTNKIVYEIKPSTLIEEEKNKAKLNSLYEWANQNTYSVEVITEIQLKKMFLSLYKQRDNSNIINFFVEKYKWHL